MGTLSTTPGAVSSRNPPKSTVMADEEAKQKEQLNATLKEYISKWRATREKEEEELKKLKEKQAKRKEIRAEQEKKLNQQKKEEEEKLRKEEADKRAAEAEEKKKHKRRPRPRGRRCSMPRRPTRLAPPPRSPPLALRATMPAR